MALVALVQAAAEADPARWARDSGPADRALLDLLCVLALRSGEAVLDLDVRRAALATGFGRSTMHRASSRLCLDGWAARRDSPGPAGTLELLAAPTAGTGRALSAAVNAACEGGVGVCAWGGTQGNPPPERAHTLRGWWLKRLEGRLAAGRADVFAHGRVRGLGHHAGRVYQVLVDAPARAVGAGELVERTGYRVRSVRRLVGRMRDLLLLARAVLPVHHECPACGALPGQVCVSPDGRPVRRGRGRHRERLALARKRAAEAFYRRRTGDSVLVTAAKALGSYGVLAERARRYRTEVEVWHWWREEEAWMRAPKRGLRTGPPPTQGQKEFVLPGVVRPGRRRYPRGADGRADHTAAREEVRRALRAA